MNSLAGYVQRISKFPLKPGGYTLFGEWTDFTMVPGESHSLKQYRNEYLIGEWKLYSISTFSGRDIQSRFGVTLIPEGRTVSIEVGDVFIESNCQVEFLSVITEYTRPIVGRLKEHQDSSHVLIYPSKLSTMMAVISQEKYGHDLSTEIIVNSAGMDIPVRVTEQRISIDKANPFEIKIDGESQISLKTFINTMSPVRAFLIDAGEESFIGEPGKKIRRRQSMHEPKMSLKAGSIRIFLSPMENSQTNLFVEKGIPYQMLYRAMELAEKASPEELNHYLSSQFYDVRKYLHHLQSITRSISKSNSLDIIIGSVKSIRLTDRAFTTIESAIGMLEKRKIKVEGELYAIDTKRNWFKVLDDRTGTDWKFTVRKADNPFASVESASTHVVVVGETYTPEFTSKGIADFIQLITTAEQE